MLPAIALILLERFGVIAIQYAQRNWRWGERRVVLTLDEKSECKVCIRHHGHTEEAPPM